MKQGTKTIFLVFLNLYGMLCPSYGQGRYISRWYASPYFYRLNTDDGLSNRQVNDIRQDYLGFMWFGTANGLDRYDGHEIKSYYFSIEDTTSITNNNISKVFEDSDQRLWVGTTNGLNLYNREKNNFVQFLNDSTDEKSLGDNQIEDIIEDSEGNIWIATYNGLNRWNEQDSTFTKYLTTTEKKNSYSQIFT
ncbi:MAG: two-component regulator propeller domain-containing protein, partial [Bacteroidota bacterium]